MSYFLSDTFVLDFSLKLKAFSSSVSFAPSLWRLTNPRQVMFLKRPLVKPSGLERSQYHAAFRLADQPAVWPPRSGLETACIRDVMIVGLLVAKPFSIQTLRDYQQTKALVQQTHAF
jgi:hypothetical protein